MTFKDLLDAVPEAEADLAEKKEQLDQAKAAYEAAIQEEADAEVRYRAAHDAIANRLRDRGHHATFDVDGGMTVYHANEGAPNGWSSYQPIPGDAAL